MAEINGNLWNISDVDIKNWLLSPGKTVEIGAGPAFSLIDGSYGVEIDLEKNDKHIYLKISLDKQMIARLYLATIQQGITLEEIKDLVVWLH